jgi:HEAT repeat protein
VFAFLRRLLAGPKRPAPPPLVLQARSDDPQARRQAAADLAAIPEVWAIDELARLLADRSEPVRLAAAESLRQFGVGAYPQLLDALNHVEPGVGVLAAQLLGAMGRAEAVEPLLAALSYAARPVQLAARRALEQLGPLAVPALEAARVDPQPWVHQQIEGALEKIRAPAPEDTAGGPVRS